MAVEGEHVALGVRLRGCIQRFPPGGEHVAGSVEWDEYFSDGRRNHKDHDIQEHPSQNLGVIFLVGV